MLALFIMTLLQHGGGGRLWSHGGTFSRSGALPAHYPRRMVLLTARAAPVFKRSRRFPSISSPGCWSCCCWR
ncbi:hypothetical protein O0544_19960 [Edwardsiella anguillarum]|nr:hypothetical protein [Edwardsiella anguillarum]